MIISYTGDIEGQKYIKDKHIIYREAFEERIQHRYIFGTQVGFRPLFSEDFIPLDICIDDNGKVLENLPTGVSNEDVYNTLFHEKVYHFFKENPDKKYCEYSYN